MGGRIGYYGGIVRNGLVLDLDAAKLDSYPRTGTSWRDISGNQNNGTLINGPTFDSGNGGSIKFDRVDDYIKIPDNSILRPTIFTLDVWFKPTAFVTYYNTIITKPYNGPQWFPPYLSYMIRINNYGTRLECSTNNGNYSYLHTDYAFTVNTIYNVIFTYNSNTGVAIAYLNGNQINSTTFGVGNILYTTFPLVIGSSGGYVDTGGLITEFFSGNIYNVKTYNKALSAQEVLQNYNATKTRFGL